MADRMVAGRRRPRLIIASTVPITAYLFQRGLIAELDARGYQVIAVSSPGDHLDRLRRDCRADVVAIPMNREISPAADMVALARMTWLMVRRRPKVVVAMTPKASLLAMIAARLTFRPRRVYVLAGLRLEGATGFSRRVLAAAERLTSSAANLVVAVSSSLAQRYAALGLAPSRKITSTQPGSLYGVDVDHFSADSDPAESVSAQLTPGAPVVGLVGRLTADKGIDTVIEALTILKARGRNIQVLAVGSDDEPDSASFLEPLRRAAGSLLAVGHVDDVRPYYRAMDLHVLATRREGFPNVVLEAAAMGIPTVTTSATGAVDSIRDGVTGLLVDVGDPTGLADAIDRLIRQPELRSRMSAAAQRWVTADFGAAKMNRQMADLITGIYELPRQMTGSHYVIGRGE